MFTYKARVVFTAKAASELKRNDGNDNKKYPHYFVIDRDTLVKANNERLRDFERWYNDATGENVNLIKSRGWNILSDSDHAKDVWEQLRHGFGSNGAGAIMTVKKGRRRGFWVVSPNVENNNLTVSQWRQASVKYKAAFMGYAPNDQKHKQIGYKFAHIVRPNDILLIARRYKNKPEVVGFGVVVGKFKNSLRGFKLKFDSLRKLSPFRPQSAAPPKLPIMHALGQTTALRKLHPNKSLNHRRICEWMERKLGEKVTANKRRVGKSQVLDPQLVNLPHEHELEYEVRTRRKVVLAKKTEAELVGRYRKWLKDQQRKLLTVKFKNLRCDAYEGARGNLIEAKCSTEREYIRMAVGQLLDYAYLGRAHFGKPNMAILLPKRPDQKSVEWLSDLHISIVWKEKNVFLDNANGLFT